MRDPSLTIRDVTCNSHKVTQLVVYYKEYVYVHNLYMHATCSSYSCSALFTHVVMHYLLMWLCIIYLYSGIH